MVSRKTVFIDIPVWIRISVIAYIVFFRLITPAIAAFGSLEPVPMLLERLVVESVYAFLLMFPFLFYRAEFGFIHPLIFPTLFLLTKEAVKNPLHLIAPIQSPIVSFEASTSSGSQALQHLTASELASARIELTLLYCVSLAIYYSAFFLMPKLRAARLTFERPTLLVSKSLCIVGFAAMIVIGFIAVKGGLSAHIVSLTLPRHLSLGGLGHIAEFGSLATFAAAIWFAYDDKAIRNPLFWLAVVVSAFVVLIFAGARSEVVYFVILLLLIEIFRRNSIPYFKAAMVAGMALLLFGAVGLVRSDWGAKDVNWTAFTNFDVSAWVSKAAAEIKMRKNEEPDLAALVNIESAGHLYGRTYVGAAFFWLPRAIWKDKPRSADSYNSFVNFDGGSIADELPDNSGSIPLGPELEAYWNFHLPGVALFAVLMGVFHRLLVLTMTAYRHVPAMWVLYSFALFHLVGTSLSFVNTVRGLVSIVILLIIMGVFRLTRQKKVVVHDRRPEPMSVSR